MITLSRARQLIDNNLSLIVIGDKKVPWTKWKEYQTKIVDKDVFDKLYNDERTKGIGIITGYNDLEVIDVDLKVLPSLKEQQDFWSEYVSFLRDNIDMFDEKFVIYKTVNNGFHILYRCKTIGGNIKLAKQKGFKEAIIETRGTGGYVFVYENQISKKSYTEIGYISEIDRECLLDISKTYNYVDNEVKPEPQKLEYKTAEVKPWEEYNSKTSIFDIIGNDFKIVRNLSDKYIIKRHGAQSAYSGYVYKDSGCMYLFTTATEFPNEKLVSPFSAYTYKNFKGDFKLAASDIYKKGFGSRIVKEPKEVKEKTIINTSELIFPIDIFPTELQYYITQCNKTLNSSIDYMGCSLLWLMSVMIGNSLQIKVKNGWVESANVWIAIVGKAGLGKTPSISNIIFPLMKANNNEIKNFIKQNDKYQYYISLDKEEKNNNEEIKKPVKTQFIVNDITLEALVDLHEDSDNAVGVFKDELAGWFKDMNKYRAGSDLEFWLSSWSGKAVSLNRKSTKSSFVEKPFIPVLGGIQPSIFNTFYTEENKDNGFIDRMLLSYPELEIDNYNDNEMTEELLTWYNDAIIGCYDFIKKHVLFRNEIDREINSRVAEFSVDAKVEWIRIFNEITTTQNSHDENEYMKSMLPKQKSYIPRFALLINTLDCLFNKKPNLEVISKESLLKAEKLSKYFVAMAKKIKVNSVAMCDIKTALELNKSKTTKEKFTILYKENKELNKVEVSEMLGVSRNTIYRFIKEIENEK